MLKSLCLRCAMFLGTVAAVAGVASAAPTIRIGPYLQDAEPSSVWIMWETTEPSTSEVDFGPSAALGQTVFGSSFVNNGTNSINQVQLTGLAADTPYYYRVRSGTAQSAVFRFHTPPLPTSEAFFRFVAYSDTQGGSVSNKHTEIINQGVINFVATNFGAELSDELAFSIEPGDLVDNGTVYDQWKTQWFDEEQNLTQHVPVYPVPGNHEQDSPYFFKYFKLPENGTPAYIEHWWYKDYGNVRVVGIDTNSGYRLQQQLDWFDTVLADAATRDHIDFVFAQMHHPYKSEMWKPGELDYTGEIIRRMEQFSTSTGKPTIHFFGHTHAYSRGQSRDHDHLWVNVASGEGNIDYWGASSMADYDEFQRSFVDWGFVVMEVTAGGNPQFRLRRVSRGNNVVPKNNEVMDDITIRRFNDAPATPGVVSPVSGATVAASGAVLQGGGFSDINSDTHLESQFQITSTQGNYAAPAVDKWIRIENWYAPPGASGQATGYYSVNTVSDPDVTRLTLGDLAPNSTYYWRVRYRDNALKWSAWSNEGSFNTGVAVVGSCCLRSGACVQLRSVDCVAQRGVYGGDNSPCVPNPCPPMVVLFSENFDSVPLGPKVDESLAGTNVWSAAFPAGWSVNNAGMPTGGVTEWRGWSVASRDWWSHVDASVQRRDEFTLASGAVAVADPDEWDDLAHAAGTFNSYLNTPTVTITAAAEGSLRLVFDSSWRPEDVQTAVLLASYNGGAPVEVLRWTSNPLDTTYKADATNETVVLPLTPPVGATSVSFSFGMINAGNNWWWAIDNVMLIGDPGDGRRTIMFEDFEGVVLGPKVNETLAGTNVWSQTPPTGWSVDDSGVPTINNPAAGMKEWEGWAFTSTLWWVSIAGDQNRSQFTRGVGTIAVADPDEWDDRGTPAPRTLGTYNATMTTVSIPLSGLDYSSLRVEFDSSWRFEGVQRAELLAEFDSGLPPQVLLNWTSAAGANFKPDATDEHVMLNFQAPVGATSVRLRFGLFDAGNNWWWAVDNLAVTAVDKACKADVNNSGDVTVQDIFDFLAAWFASSPTGDFNGSGALSVQDIFDFLSAWFAGC